MNIGVGISTRWSVEGRRIEDGRLVLAVDTKHADLGIEGVIDTDVALVVLNRTARKVREVVREGVRRTGQSTGIRCWKSGED